MGIVAGPRIAIPSFLNQYSYNFDGVNDVIREESLSFIPPPVISISVWVKTDFTTGGDTTNIGYIVTKDDVGSKRDIILNYRGTGYNKLNFAFWSPSGVLSSLASPTFPLGNPTDGNWHHVLATWDGTTDANKIQLFVDGSLIAQATANDTGIRNSTTTNLTIGGPDSATNTRLFYGNIDEVAIFNTDQSANVAEIYNGGVPTDLTDLSPMTWWRMGENATWRDPQWLLPSNENKDKASNYSMTFDGINDYVYVPDAPDLRFGTGDFTISTWFKAPSPSDFRTIISKGNDTGGGGFQLYLRNDSTIRLYYDSTFILTDSANPFDNAWHHLVVTRIGTAFVMYVDNSSVDTSSPTLKDFSSTDLLRIGVRSNLGNDYLGNIDELSLWNKGLSASEVSELYNNGIPSNLASHSSYSNAISWWRMGEDATFDGTNWTVPDNAGSNDGTSANMTLSDRVGDAPNSINNVLSLNMVEVDRETDVPT
jgi:hypothetical protein